MAGSFEKITLGGTPEDIGFEHGRLLREQIHKNIDFYKPIFLKNLGDTAHVFNAARTIKEKIAQFNPNYIREIDQIALGAEVNEPRWLYAMNSRTELALTNKSHECTAVVIPEQSIIGQTWDWAQDIEDTSVLMEIELQSGRKILQLTEAGIIGKIGLNSRGLGQTLNILWVVDQVLLGVPIHIVLRVLLESGTLEEALEAITRSGHGKASNIIIAGTGRAFDIEFDGGEPHCHEIRERVYAHTNHYLHMEKPGQWDDPERANSITRYQTALSKLRHFERHTSESMAAILSDQSQRENSILCPYQVDIQIDMGYCGTVATLVMDLEKGVLMVRKGNPRSPSFNEDAFIHYSI